MSSVGGPSQALPLAPMVDNRRLGFDPPRRRDMVFGQGQDITLDDILAKAWNQLGERVLPLAEPAYSLPPYWARPLTLTRIRVIAAGAPWTEFLRVVIDPEHVVVVKQFVATCEGAMSTNGLQYRLRYGRGVLTQVQLDQGIDLCRDVAAGASAWPAQRRDLMLINSNYRNNDSGVQLQVRNTGPADVRACAGLLGWIFRDRTEAGGGGSAGVDPQ